MHRLPVLCKILGSVPLKDIEHAADRFVHQLQNEMRRP